MKGKEKCEFLKQIRVRMAELNGIPYEPRECHHEGDCAGTCPLCDKEAAELMAELKKREAEGVEIKTDDVGILAIELGVNECEGTDKNEDDDIITPGFVGTLVNVNSDTSTSHVDPFRGSNNPLVTEKDLHEIRQDIHGERKTLMGDIDDEAWRKHKKEEMHKKMEEIIRREKKETTGYIRRDVYEKEMDEKRIH